MRNRETRTRKGDLSIKTVAVITMAIVVVVLVITGVHEWFGTILEEFVSQVTFPETE